MLEQMLKDFDKEYDYLYNTGKESQKNIDEFDKKMKNNFAFRLLVTAFAEARQDYITSDREADAFMRVFKKMQKENKERKEAA